MDLRKKDFLHSILSLAALCAVVLLLYGRSLMFSFVLDDWTLVGPPAGRGFLENPLSYLATPQYFGHFAPVAKLYYGLTSLAFSTNPFPYHALVLLLTVAAGTLLQRFLSLRGISPLPALFAAVYLCTAWAHQMVFLWITASNYLLLAIFLILTLHSWETYLLHGRRKDLFLSFLFLGLGLWTHSLAVIVPFLMGVLLLGRGNPHPFTVRHALAPLGASCLLAGALVGLPRLFLRASGFQAQFCLWPPTWLKGIYLAFSNVILPGFIGSHYIKYLPIERLPGALPLTILFLLLLGGFLLLWIRRRERWSLAFMGFAATFLGLLVPLASIWSCSPERFSVKFRYMFIPDLGIAILLAVLLQSPSSLLRASWRRHLGWIQALFLALFLYLNFTDISTGIDIRLAEDRYVRQTAGSYVRSLEQILAVSPCGTIVVHDVPLVMTLPTSLSTDLFVTLTDHAAIHGFYFADRDDVLARVSIRKYVQGVEQSGDDCAYLAIAGRLIPLKMNR